MKYLFLNFFQTKSVHISALVQFTSPAIHASALVTSINILRITGLFPHSINIYATLPLCQTFCLRSFNGKGWHATLSYWRRWHDMALLTQGRGGHLWPVKRQDEVSCEQTLCREGLGQQGSTCKSHKSEPGLVVLVPALRGGGWGRVWGQPRLYKETLPQ